jgi:hypothetical protein
VKEGNEDPPCRLTSIVRGLLAKLRARHLSRGGAFCVDRKQWLKLHVGDHVLHHRDVAAAASAEETELGRVPKIELDCYSMSDMRR